MAIIGYMPLAAAQGAANRHGSPSVLITPGLSVGPLKLGDTRDKVLTLFPFKRNVDQEFDQKPDCGTEFNWVDMKPLGNVFVRMRDNVVFQIDAATSRYRTADGITVGSPPEEVRKHYPGMHSYVLTNITSLAFGDRPIVYWISRKKGIAFGFARSRNGRKRYLYEIIVFKPDSEVCPTDDSTNSPAKRELPPYSLEPSDTDED
jgi:hypothetical protein